MSDFIINNGILEKCKSNISMVILSSDVTEIGVEAFIGMTKLKTIKFPNGLTKINKRAFYNCYLLREVIFPENDFKIENSAFANCVCLDDKSRKIIVRINPMAFL